MRPSARPRLLSSSTFTSSADIEGRLGHSTGREGPAGFDGGRRRRAGRLWSPSPPPAAGVGCSHGNADRRSGCASRNPDDVEVRAASRQVRFTLQRDSPYPFVVNARIGKSVYPFPGMLGDSDRKDTPVGVSSVAVPQPSNPGPLCCPRTTLRPFLFPLDSGSAMKICRYIGPRQRASPGISRPVWGSPPPLLRLWKKSPLG